MVWLKAPNSHNDECQRTEQIANGYGKKYDKYAYRHLYYDNQQLHLTLFTRFFKYYPPDSVPATRTRTLVPIRAAPRPHLTSAVSCQVGHLLKGIQEGCYSDNRRPGRHKTGSRNTEKAVSIHYFFLAGFLIFYWKKIMLNSFDLFFVFLISCHHSADL